MVTTSRYTSGIIPLNKQPSVCLTSFQSLVYTCRSYQTKVQTFFPALMQENWHSQDADLTLPSPVKWETGKVSCNFEMHVVKSTSLKDLIGHLCWIGFCTMLGTFQAPDMATPLTIFINHKITLAF